MSSAARKHEIHAADPEGVAYEDELHAADPSSEELGRVEGTEYATRGARRARSSRPHLRIVSPLRPERASRGMFALIVTGLLGVGMVAILVINTSLAQGAFTVSELQAQQATLAQQEDALTQQVQAAAAPDALAKEARALGMVPSSNPVFLSLPKGRIIGTPRPAGGAHATVPRLLTPADATAAEAVDNAGADLPAPLPAGYDPAAADAAAAGAGAATQPVPDAAAQQAKAATEAAAAQAATQATIAAAGAPLGSVAANDAAAAAAVNADVKSGAAPLAKHTATHGKAGKASENGLWHDTTVLDVPSGSGDSGLSAVPVR